MSVIDDLRKEGIKLTPEQAKALREKVKEYKKERDATLKLMRKLFATRRDKKGRLINASDRKTYKRLKMQYGEADKKVHRLGGKSKELPYEEFS